MIEQNARQWHETLIQALWAYRTSSHSTTNITRFQLVYGQEAVLPLEINVQSMRIALQTNLSEEDYTEAMMQNLLELDEIILDALTRIEIQKAKVAKCYNKRVVAKSFEREELVWKARLAFETKDPKYGKWPPNWEGPYQVQSVLPNGAYHLKDLEGDVHIHAINGKYLKKYIPSVWEHDNI
ncbi:uncharacterized protein LOC119985541 [Tripterygium wilfordii]|uniref:uncharacterized protein LOC119985541 n=1 Tax=Tripterygium wilfordii TaxID=458696 RepID=UPI0018F7F8E5|nr:uncharacterized protein LOC119985541 [Tripterygium wilfordii]